MTAVASGDNTRSSKPKALAAGTRELSPLGETHGQAQARRSKNPAYRRAQAAMAPFEELARLVISRRQELDLTQQALAELMNTSYSAISRIESGQHRTNLETLQKLAEGLQLELTLDFRAADNPAPKPKGKRRSSQPAFAARVKL